MKKIELGLFPIDQPFYEVVDIAMRYAVHEKTVYAGIKSADPMYPFPVFRTPSTASRIFVVMDEIDACDKRRIEFYRTTRSWLGEEDLARWKRFVRRTAREVLGPPKVQGGPARQDEQAE